MLPTTKRGRRLSNATESTNWELLSGRSTSVDTVLRSPLIELWETTDEEESVTNIVSQPTSVASTVRIDPLSPRAIKSAPEQASRYPLGKQGCPNAFTFIDGRFQLRRRTSVSRTRRRNGSRAGRRGAGGARRKSASLPRGSVRPPAPPSHHIPLLRIFSALFGIEDATLSLLAGPTNTSSPSLFPGRSMHSTEDAAEDNRVTPLEASEIAALKHGIDATIDPSLRSDNAFGIPSVPFPSLWGLVSGLRKVPRTM